MIWLGTPRHHQQVLIGSEISWKTDGSNVLDWFAICAAIPPPPLPLSCIWNHCSLFDGRQLQEIVFLLLYTPVGTVPPFLLGKECPVFLLDRRTQLQDEHHLASQAQ